MDFFAKTFSPYKGNVGSACDKWINVSIPTCLVNVRVFFVCLHFESRRKWESVKAQVQTEERVWTLTSTTAHPSRANDNRQTTTIDRYSYATSRLTTTLRKEVCVSNLEKKGGKSSDRPFEGSESIVHVQEQHFLYFVCFRLTGFLE